MVGNFGLCPILFSEKHGGTTMARNWLRRFGLVQSTRRRQRVRDLRTRRLTSEQLENRQLLAANMFHNEAMPEDVTEDGFVTVIDALTVVNQLSRNDLGGERGDSETRGRGRMTDVNNDGRDSPIDALMVINRINRGHRDGGGNRGDMPVDDGPSQQQQSDAVLEWNEFFGELLVANEANQNPGFASRAMAMMNLAIYDAVTLASGDRSDAFYDYGNEARVGGRVNAELAASQAAYTVLSGLYPDQQAMIDAFRDASFSDMRRSRVVDASVELGNAVGNHILEARANDGSDVAGEYHYSEEEGYFQHDPLNPEVPVWGPAWGDVQPYAIGSVDDFVPASPPDLSSAEYAASYDEVKELGSVDSDSRTADQTEAGIFWAYDRVGLGTPMALFSDALETIAQQQGNNLEQNAALFAQASVAMADAGIVAWRTKFGEEFWRPVTAIRNGDADGNALTEGDVDWTAIGAPDGGDDIVGFTPQFPTYISGHATFGGAVFGAIQEFYGTDDIAFTLASEELAILMANPELQTAYGLELDDAERSFDSLSEAMAENGRSRVYLGIHFDFDDLVGQDVGQAVAADVATQFTVPDLGGRDGSGMRA